MIRGTTPTHAYTIPFDVGNVAKVHIIYAQRGSVKFVKTEADCTMDGKTITTRLTQEETLSLVDGNCVDIQIRVLTTTNEAFASQPMKATVCACLEEEVLS